MQKWEGVVKRRIWMRTLLCKYLEFYLHMHLHMHMHMRMHMQIHLNLHMSGNSQGVKRPYPGHKIILCNTLM